MIFSASNVETVIRYGATPYTYFLRQTLFLAVGLIGAFFIIKIPTKNYKKFMYPALVVIIVSLVYLILKGHMVNNAASWIPIGPFKFQPSEFAKIVLIVFFGSYYEMHKKELNDNEFSLLFPLGIGVLLCMLIYLQPDLGTTIILGAIMAILFLSLPISKEKKFKYIGISAIVISVALVAVMVKGKDFLTEAQKSRFDFREPCKRYEEGGYQVCNAYIAINNGGLLGVGIGKSTQKYLYLSEAHTDSIMAIIMEELGLVSALGIILCYFFIIARILVISKNSHNLRNAMITYGIAIYIFLHIMINLMGLFGLMPLTGVPLPFMSYGGSFSLNLIIALTIVQRIRYENEKVKRKKLSEGKMEPA